MTSTLTQTAPRRVAPDHALGAWAIAVSAIGFGFSPFFAQRAFDAGVDPVAASFARIALLCLVLSPSARHLRNWPRTSLIVAAGGAVSMLGFAGYFVALQRAPVAAATVVYYTYPAIVLVISALWWRRRPHPREVLACCMILAGVGLCVAPMESTGGALLALAPAAAAPVGWAIYLLVLSGPAAAMPTTPKMFAGSLGGVIALLPFAAIRTDFGFVPWTQESGTAIALLTLCTLAIPALFVTWGAPRAGDRATAMIGSAEFVVAIAVAWALMGGSMSPLQLLGIVMMLAAAASGVTAARERDAISRSAGHATPASRVRGRRSRLH